MFTGVCILIGAFVVRRPIILLKKEVEKFNNIFSRKKV